MEQTLGKSRVLRESVMVLFTEQKVDHENRPQIFQAVLGKTKISTEVKHVKGQIGSKTGRGKNRLQPNPEATGDHSTFKTDKDGKITNTATYIVNPQNPSGFQEVKRVDRFGASHNGIPTPHVHENGKVRPAKKEDL